MSIKVLVTGCYGQDGSYLSEKLYNQGYEVYGLCRKELSRNSMLNKRELVQNKIFLNEVNSPLLNYNALSDTIKRIMPDYLFHMAAIHFSSENISNNILESEKMLFENNVISTNNILCACMEYSPNTRVITAGSCLMFDNSKTSIQNEETKYDSNSLYGIAKIAEQTLVEYYRSKGLFASMAILYNHESHRRADSFITKKIVNMLKKIRSGELSQIELGDITIKKDWGFAGDYVDAMISMSMTETPRDYILATGELHTIKEFADACAQELGIGDWEQYLSVNKNLLTRKIDCQLCGDSKLAQTHLGWRRSMSFTELVNEIIEGD